MVVVNLAAAQAALLLGQAGTTVGAAALGTGVGTLVPTDVMLGGTTGFNGYTAEGFFEDAIADAAEGVTADDGFALLSGGIGGGPSFANQLGIPSYADQGFVPGVEAVAYGAPVMDYQPSFGKPSPNVFRPLESRAQTRELVRGAANDALGLVSDDLEIPRPTGQFANQLDAATLALGGTLFLVMITRAYRHLATQPGISPLSSALKLAAYTFGATVFGARVATDVLSAAYRNEKFTLDLQHLLMDATYAELGVWALVAFVWAWVAGAKYPQARFWMNRFMPYETERRPQILSKKIFHFPEEEGVVSRLFDRPGAIAETQPQMEFSVDADYLARPPVVARLYRDAKDSPVGQALGWGLDKLRYALGWTTNAAVRLGLNVVPIRLVNLVARPLGLGVTPVRHYLHKPARPGASYRSIDQAFSSLQGAGGKISFEADPSNIGEIRTVVRALNEAGISVKSVHTTVKNVSDPTTVQPNGQTYRVLEGAWILEKDGTKVKISETMTVTDETGPVTVLEGGIEGKGTIDVLDLKTLRKHGHSKFEFEIESRDLARDLPRVSQALVRRPVSRPFWRSRWQYLNPYAWGGLATNLIPFIPLPGVSQGLRQTIRRSLAPTPLTITVNQPRGLSGADLERFDGSIGVLAAQRRTTSRMKHPPKTHLAKPMMEGLVEDGLVKAMTTLEVTAAFLKSREGRLLLEELKEASGDTLRQEADSHSGVVFLTLPTQAVESLLSRRSRLAHYAKRPSWSSQRVNVALPNPLTDAGFAWKISAPETEALKLGIRRGDSRSRADIIKGRRVVRKYSPGFLGAGGGWHGMTASAGYFLYDLTVGNAVSLWNLTRTVTLGSIRSFRLDRQIAVAAVTIGGGVLSMPVTSLMKAAAGWRDLGVILVSGSRVFLTGGLNALAGPGLMAYAGPAKFDGFFTYIASMTALRLWELPNEAKEQDRMLYKQVLLDLLDEDRPEVRAALAQRLIEIETRAQDRNREGILVLRLKHLLDTGVVKSGDLEIIRTRYDEIKDDPERAAHFLLALALNESLLEVMRQPHLHPDVVDPEEAPQVWAFWQQEFAAHAAEVQALRGQYFGQGTQTATRQADDTGALASR